MLEKVIGDIKMSKICAIISGGEYSPINIPKDAFVVACDRGYEYAMREGIKPDLVIGDFDSYDGELPVDVPVMRLKAEKDDTDTMVAVKYAIENGFDEVRLFCALGGRFDHAFANLQSGVYAKAHGLNLKVLSDDTEIYFLSNETVSFPRREGYSLSVFALTDSCSGLTLKGTKYPLESFTLTNTFPLGVSNEWRADAAEITVSDGVLAVVLSR